MERILGVALLSLCWLSLHQNGECQVPSDATDQIEQFTVAGSSRLHALANLGRITKSTLLIEGGDMTFLEEPVTLIAHEKTSNELIVATLP